MNTAQATGLLSVVQTERIDKYKVTELLGCGGSAAVFKATTHEGLECAIKIYDPDLTDHVDRLDRELSLVGRNCKTLVQIYGGGEIERDGIRYVYVAMELVDGTDLSEQVTLTRRFDDPTIRRLGLQLLTAADFLLQLGLCHRDIKPANIRIRPNGDLVLLDLGVLRPVIGSNLTDDGRGRRFLGTRRYTPPELQHRVHDDTPEAWEAITAYQIGAVLYEMIHGCLLFANVSDQPPADLVVAVDSMQPHVFRSDVGSDLLSLTRGCLLKDPKVRLHHASMAKIRDCLSAPTPPVLVANPGLDSHFQEAADRYVREIVSRDNEYTRRNIRRFENYGAADSIVGIELQRFLEPMCSVTMFNGPGEGDGSIRVASCQEDISKGIATDFWIAVLINPGVEPEFVRVRGIGIISRDLRMGPDVMSRLAANAGLVKSFENIFDEVYNEDSVRIAVRNWLTAILSRYISETTRIYEAELAAQIRERDARLQAQTSHVRAERVVPTATLTTTELRILKDVWNTN